MFLIEKCWHVSFHCVLNWFNDTSHHFSVYFGNFNYIFVSILVIAIYFNISFFCLFLVYLFVLNFTYFCFWLVCNFLQSQDNQIIWGVCVCEFGLFLAHTFFRVCFFVNNFCLFPK